MAPTAIAAPLNGKTRIAAFPLFVWMAEAKLPRAGRPTSHVATVYVFWVSLQPVRNIACLGSGVWGAWPTWPAWWSVLRQRVSDGQRRHAIYVLDAASIAVRGNN